MPKGHRVIQRTVSSVFWYKELQEILENSPFENSPIRIRLYTVTQVTDCRP